MKRTWMALAALTAAALTPVSSSPALADAGHYTGTLADGSSWIADVPARWNGTLLLFSHGFGPTVAQDSPSSAATSALLAKGYAMAGSSYDPNGSWWALGSAVGDQLGTASAFASAVGRPRRTIAFGMSMGGLISAKVAETGRVNGALTTCGIVAGAADLNNYQLNASYTINRLLAGGSAKLTGYTSPLDGGAAAAQLTAAVTGAQATPAGRARIALASAFLNQSAWYPGQAKPGPADYAGQEAQQYQWLTSGATIAFVVGARYYIELAAGGDSGWTAGVDYAALLRRSSHQTEVRALYRAAGLSLNSDLSDLTAHASIKRDPGALPWILRTSVPTGRLPVPELDLHTISDQLVPVEQERQYAARVAAAGRSSLLRQAYVDHAGHCNFTTAELVAGVEAVTHRLDTGRWRTSPAQLNTAAGALGLDGSAFLSYRPSVLVTQRVP